MTDERPDWHAARRAAFRAGSPLPSVTVALEDAAGLVLASPVEALVDLPHYASSAMDGWAVRGAPAWRVVDRDAPVGEGECVPILTGSPIPEGVTAVLRRERSAMVERDGGRVIVPGPDARPDEPRPGEHLRRAGTEARRGETLIDAGARVTPASIALAAAAGHDTLVVRPRPRAAVVLTGDEVVARGIPAPGRVRDSFGPVLPTVLAGLGADCLSVVRVPDIRPTLIDALRSAARDADVVITTGGTGRSDADHLRPALDALGATVLVDGIRMRPGGPSLLASLPDGVLVVGLPGNPLAAIMGLLTLGAPLLAALAGSPEPPMGGAAAGADLPGHPDATVLVPCRVVDGGAHPREHRGAAMMRGLADADAVLVCPPGGVSAGDAVELLDLPW